EKKIRQVLDRHKLKPAFIINTHAHFDHIGCDDKFGVPVYIHEDDLALLKDPQLNLSNWLDSSYASKAQIKTLQDHEKIELGMMQLEVIHTPGHTPGGICLSLIRPVNKILFSGDTLFCLGVGRTDFPMADEGLLIKSIKDRLFVLSDDTVVYPGHGPSTTIAEEKKNNPFLT
ncbi:MAG: MBL fold metallo-hydrolase, partial [bacterium]